MTSKEAEASVVRAVFSIDEIALLMGALLLLPLKEVRAKNKVSRQTMDDGKKIFFTTRWVFRGYLENAASAKIVCGSSTCKQLLGYLLTGNKNTNKC